ANKDDHFQLGNDEREHQLPFRTDNLGASAKENCTIGSKFPQEKAKLVANEDADNDNDDDFDEEEAEEKSS
ncbi:hypothetical protein J0S82_014447, partial [Galemys pyrenaicus]